jgi:hypothetical protein
MTYEVRLSDTYRLGGLGGRWQRGLDDFKWHLSTEANFYKSRKAI